MFPKMIWLSEFWRSGFKCEEFIPLCFHLQMLNDRILKPNNETCLKCKNAGTILENYFGWGSSRRESELPMELGCKRSCEPPGRVQMHNPGKVH